METDVTPTAPTNAILRFYRKEAPDWDGRWLDEVRSWDFERLEDDHHFIQWLFPLETESEAVFAPVLQPADITLFREDPQLRDELLRSLQVMLAFYGFELQESGGDVTISVSNQFPGRQDIWMTENNHNYLRISRIIKSLGMLGLGKYARAFYRALTQVYQTPEGRLQIDLMSFWYWTEYASQAS